LNIPFQKFKNILDSYSINVNPLRKIIYLKVKKNKFCSRDFEFFLNRYCSEVLNFKNRYRITLKDDNTIVDVFCHPNKYKFDSKNGFQSLDFIEKQESEILFKKVNKLLKFANQHANSAAYFFENNNKNDAKQMLTQSRALLVSGINMMCFRSFEPQLELSPFGAYADILNILKDNGFKNQLISTIQCIFITKNMLHDFTSKGPESENFRIGESIKSIFNNIDLKKKKFSTWYSIYQARNYEKFRPLPNIVLKKITEVVNSLNVKKAVELGCGTGRISLEIAKELDHIYALDPSIPMIEELKRTLVNCQQKNITPLVQSMIHTNLKDSSCDLVVESESFFFIPCIELLTKEIDRILSNTGILIRIVKCEYYSDNFTKIINNFNKIISGMTTDGVFFVGEGIDKKLDISLKEIGIETIWFNLHEESQKVEVNELIKPYKNRAYPYLNKINKKYINLIIKKLINVVDEKKLETFTKSYYLGISFKSNCKKSINKINEIEKSNLGKRLKNDITYSF